MIVSEKLEAVKQKLQDLRIDYMENVDVKDSDIFIPLYIPKGRVAVRLGDDDDWFHQLRKVVHPVFIRATDSVDFVIEKVLNTIKRNSSSGPRPRSFTSRQKRYFRQLQLFRNKLSASIDYCFDKPKKRKKIKVKNDKK